MYVHVCDTYKHTEEQKEITYKNRKRERNGNIEKMEKIGSVRKRSILVIKERKKN